METFLLVLFLAGHTIEPDTNYPSFDACREEGKIIVKAFKKEHPHASGWFWCYPGRKT